MLKKKKQECCWPVTNGLPLISPAKMNLPCISTELQLWVCNHGEPSAVRVPTWQEKENTFTEGKRKLTGQQRVHGSSLAESLPGMKRSLSSSCWALLWSQGVRTPSSGLSTIFEVSVHWFFIVSYVYVYWELLHIALFTYLQYM